MRELLARRTLAISGSSEIVTALETFYDAPVKLTLGKLRVILKSLAELVAISPGRSPSIAEIASVVRGLGISELPLATIVALLGAVRPTFDGDVLAALTLKQLEELLSRIERS